MVDGNQRHIVCQVCIVNFVISGTAQRSESIGSARLWQELHHGWVHWGTKSTWTIITRLIGSRAFGTHPMPSSCAIQCALQCQRAQFNAHSICSSVRIECHHARFNAHFLCHECTCFVTNARVLGKHTCFCNKNTRVSATRSATSGNTCARASNCASNSATNWVEGD